MEKENENKVWIGKDGILYVKMIKARVEDDAFEVLGKIEDALKKSPPETKVLITILTSSIIKPSRFRKRCAQRIKEVYEKTGFGKTAIFGLTVIPRAIANFIIVASGVKNIKIFSNEEEALKWLKE